MLGSNTSSRSSAYLYQRLIAHVERGQSLSSGLETFGATFGDFTVNVVRVGERSGTLHENLNYLAEELKKKQVLKKKIVGALIYPAIVIMATVGISLVLTMYIFPKIAPIFKSMGSELPITTRALIALSNFLMHHSVALVLTFIAIGVAYTALLKVARFHLVVDRVLLRLPLLGKLSQYYNLATCARTLSLLLKSDVGVVEALHIVAKSSRNYAYRSAIAALCVDVARGQNISSQLLKHPAFFPPLFSHMIIVGERTGNLTDSLMYLSDMYEEEINDLTKNLTTLVEPVLMVIMGIIVGFIAISIITPIYGMTQNLTPQ